MNKIEIEKLFKDMKEVFFKIGYIEFDLYTSEYFATSYFDVITFFKQKTKIPERDIKNLAAEKLGMPVFNKNDLNDKEFHILNERSIYFDNTIYKTNPFSNLSLNMIKNEAFNGLINNIGYISKEDLMELISENKIDKTTINNYIELKISELIDNDYMSFKILSNGKCTYNYYGEIRKKIENFSFDINDIKEKDIEVTRNGKTRNVKITKSAKNEITITLENKFNQDFKKMEIFNADKLEKCFSNNSGLIIISSNVKGEYFNVFESLFNYLNEKIETRELVYLSKDKENELSYGSFDKNNEYKDIFFLKYEENKKLIIDDLINKGKLVVLYLTANDSISALHNVIEEKIINKEILADKFIASYYYVSVPKLCSFCKVQKPSKNHILNSKKEEYFHYIFNTGGIGEFLSESSHVGCPNCVNGHKDNMIISEFFENSPSLVNKIENGFSIYEVKKEKKGNRWEDSRINAFKLASKNELSLYDIKKYIN